MSYEYSAENHDWDLTLHAAYELLQVGNAMDRQPRKGTLSMGFSAYVGSMLLSFSAIESYSASVAFTMPQTERFNEFDFTAYRREKTFWGKIDMLFSAANQNIDKSQGLFQTISTMQKWRNLVTHASPYRIDIVEIENTTTAVGRVHKPNHIKEYTRSVNRKVAAKFYQAAYDYIDFLKTGSGLDPRAQAVFKNGETPSTIS